MNYTNHIYATHNFSYHKYILNANIMSYLKENSLTVRFFYYK